MPSRSRSRSTSRSKKSSASASKAVAVKKNSRRKSKTSSKKGSRKGSKSGSKRVSQAGGSGKKMNAGFGEIFVNLAGVPSIVFAGWNQCGYCRDFIPVWDEFVSSPLITNSNIVLSTITAYGSNPIIPGLPDVTSFPSIYYTLADGTTILYGGVRDVASMRNMVFELGMADAIAEGIAESIVPTRG